MGAVCVRPEQNASKEPSGSQRSSPATAAAVATAAAPVHPQAQSEAPAKYTASDPQLDPQGTPVSPMMEEFTPGSGVGVYLLQSPESHTSLVSQYARQAPVAEGIVLLQVKAPPYKPIPNTRFVLQGGRRVLRPSIESMKDTADVKAKYCEIIMEFVNLATTYNGFLWVSSHLDTIKKPFSIFYLERVKKAPETSSEPMPEVVESMPIGGRRAQTEKKDAGKTVKLKKQAEGGESKQESEETKVTSEDLQGQKEPQCDAEEQKNEETAKKAQEDEQKGEGEKVDEVREESSKEADAEQKGHVEEGLFVRFLGPNSSVASRLLANCGIVPLPLEKAKELISEDKRVEDIEAIKTVVTKAGGFCVLQSEAAQ